MNRSPQGTLIYGAGVLLILVPFAFGAMRAISTGSDFRYLWVALATFAGALAVMWLGRARGTSVQGILTLFVAALVIGSVFGVVVAALVGARSAAAMWFVASGFALCEAAGCALQALSRTRPLGAEWRAADSPRP